MWSGAVLFLVILRSVWCHEKDFIKFAGFICPKEEEGLGRCLRDALNTYIPKLAAGIPQYGIPPLEPLLVKSLSVKQLDGPISISSSYTDVSVRGPSTMRLTSVKILSKEHEIVAKLHIPELRMKGHYKLKGNLLMLPVEGDGDFTSKYHDINATVTIILGRNKTKTDDILTCKDLTVKFHAGRVSVHMDNLFGGDTELGNAMNKFLNENWDQLSGELQEPMEEALRGFLKPIAEHTLGALKADDILSLV